MKDINKEKYIEQFKKHLDCYESCLEERLRRIKELFAKKVSPDLEYFFDEHDDFIILNWNDHSEHGDELIQEIKNILDPKENNFINYNLSVEDIWPDEEDVFNYSVYIYKCPFDILTTYSLDREE